MITYYLQKNINMESSIKQFTTLCIPRVEKSISIDYILKKLYPSKLGQIINIIEIPLKNDANFKRILFKLKWNTENSNANTIRDKLKNGEKINLVYEMPWFWKITMASK